MKKGNLNAFFREKWLTKNKYSKIINLCEIKEMQKVLPFLVRLTAG